MPYTIQEPESPAPPAPRSTAEMKAAVAKVVEAASKRPEDQPDPRDAEEWGFEFSYTDARGEPYRGAFRNKILSLGEQQEAAVLQARFQGGLPADSIPPSVANVNYAIAWMEYSLIKRPKWANDLRELKDRVLILKLWEEVSGHEAKFWRLGTDQEESEAQG